MCDDTERQSQCRSCVVTKEQGGMPMCQWWCERAFNCCITWVYSVSVDVQDEYMLGSRQLLCNALKARWCILVLSGLTCVSSHWHCRSLENVFMLRSVYVTSACEKLHSRLISHHFSTVHTPVCTVHLIACVLWNSTHGWFHITSQQCLRLVACVTRLDHVHWIYTVTQ